MGGAPGFPEPYGSLIYFLFAHTGTLAHCASAASRRQSAPHLKATPMCYLAPNGAEKNERQTLAPSARRAVRCHAVVGVRVHVGEGEGGSRSSGAGRRAWPCDRDKEATTHACMRGRVLQGQPPCEATGDGRECMRTGGGGHCTAYEDGVRPCRQALLASQRMHAGTASAP